MQRTMIAGIARTLHQQFVAFLLDGHLRWQGQLQFALRPLDGDLASIDGRGHFSGQGYRFLTDEEKDILKRAADEEDL